MSYAFNANVRDYLMIGEEGREQLYVNVFGSLMYNINYNTRLNITGGYRKQEGEGIDLDLFTGKAELSTIYNKMTIKLAAELYRKEYLLTENQDFNQVSLRIIRRF